MKTENPLVEKSCLLGVEVVAFSRHLRRSGFERAIVEQFMRSGVAPGALIAEANDSESRADMRHKFGVALKEAREAKYWFDLIAASSTSKYDRKDLIEELLNEITAMLVASRKTLSLKELK